MGEKDSPNKNKENDSIFSPIYIDTTEPSCKLACVTHENEVSCKLACITPPYGINLDFGKEDVQKVLKKIEKKYRRIDDYFSEGLED